MEAGELPVTLSNVTSSMSGVWTCEGVNGAGETSPISPPEEIDVSGRFVYALVVG